MSTCNARIFHFFLIASLLLNSMIGAAQNILIVPSRGNAVSIERDLFKQQVLASENAMSRGLLKPKIAIPLLEDAARMGKFLPDKKHSLGARTSAIFEKFNKLTPQQAESMKRDPSSLLIHLYESEIIPVLGRRFMIESSANLPDLVKAVCRIMLRHRNADVRRHLN